MWSSTSTIAQAQNAWSSSRDRSRRFPVAGSSAQTLAGSRAGPSTARPSAWPGGGERARRAGAWRPASSSAPVVLRRWSTLRTSSGQHRQPFAGAGVHAGLAVPLGLAPVDLLLADRAGRHPRAPAGRVLDGPVGQVQVEGPDRGQALPVVDPRDLEPGLLAGPVVVVFVVVRSRCFQPSATSAGSVQAVDAGMVRLEVGPEPLAQVVGQRVHAGVVQGGLAFPQVVHQQVADRAAGQPVAVDQLLGGALPAGAQLPQRRRAPARRGRRARAATGRTACGRSPGWPAAASSSASNSSRTSPTVMSASGAALGRDDQRRCGSSVWFRPRASTRADRRSHSARSRANPSGSREAARLRTRDAARPMPGEQPAAARGGSGRR